ncbi:MAG: hypothetical protein JWM68_2530 [Verrucomicrobiales bacterium]|nr:hypothetical protein [Verrucomicrobiales bacterium]
MPIASTDILVFLSTTSGAAGNSIAQGNPNLSLGKYISTTQWTGGSLHDLFDVITGDENAASTVDYRCVFLRNAHVSLAALAPFAAWLASEVGGGASLAIGVDPAGASPIGQAGAQAAIIANENTAPAGVTFTAPTTKSTGISLPAPMAAGNCVAVWIRRTAANSAPIDADGATLQCDCDTAQ